MNFSLVFTLNYLHPIHYEYIYIYPLCTWQVFKFNFLDQVSSKKFYSPRLFLHARSPLPPVAVRHRVKKSVERENSAKNPSILFPSFVSSIHSPVREKLRSTFSGFFDHPLSSSFTVSCGNARVEGRDRSALRCEFKCRLIRVNVSGIRKIGNRFLMPGENSSFTLVSPVDRRRKEQSCLETQILNRMGRSKYCYFIGRDWWGEFEIYFVPLFFFFFRKRILLRILWIYSRERFLRKIWENLGLIWMDWEEIKLVKRMNCRRLFLDWIFFRE